MTAREMQDVKAALVELSHNVTAFMERSSAQAARQHSMIRQLDCHLADLMREEANLRCQCEERLDKLEATVNELTT